MSLLLPYRISKLTPSLAKARSSSCNHSNSYSYLPDHPQITLWKKYTPRTLAVHDGSSFQVHGSKAKSPSSDHQILLAISGKVFDVTKGAHFYGPGECPLTSIKSIVWLTQALKVGPMATLQAEMLVGACPSNLLTSVSIYSWAYQVVDLLSHLSILLQTCLHRWTNRSTNWKISRQWKCKSEMQKAHVYNRFRS